MTDDTTPTPAPSAPPQLTDEQKAKIAADQARAKQIAPLRAIVNSDEYQSIVDSLKQQRNAFIDDNLMFTHINALVDVMPRFKTLLAAEPVETK